MKKILNNDFHNIFLPTEDKESNNREDDPNIFLDLMKNVEPLKNNNRFSNFEYKQIKNLSFNKSLKYKDLDDFEVNNLTRKEIKNYKKKIERTLDLHGQTSKNAEILLNKFLEMCFFQQVRFALVITGKGRNSKEKHRDIGILKSLFLSWINSNIAKKYIVSYSVAYSIHGGEGAYYILLRKNNNN